MKNRFLILTLIGLIAASIPANAELTTADTASQEYLKNHGYSDAMIEATQYTKARANGESYTPEKNPFYEKAPIKQIRYFFMNVDPAYDDDSFMKHDIKTSPHWRDL